MTSAYPCHWDSAYHLFSLSLSLHRHPRDLPSCEEFCSCAECWSMSHPSAHQLELPNQKESGTRQGGKSPTKKFCCSKLKLPYIPVNTGVGLISTINDMNNQFAGHPHQLGTAGRRRIMSQQVTTDRNSRILKEISPRIHQVVATCRCSITS